MSNFPPCPPSLKQIQHYLTLAKEHESRDIVVSYWCRLYALQEGLKLDKSSAEARQLLAALMGWLETAKTTHKENEAIVHDIPAQAHLENYALKLFLFADQQDRAGVFNKNVIRTFFTSSLIYSVLEIFGGLTEEVVKNQKYAKWKATYINNCLKNGETPVAGPLAGEGHDDFQADWNAPGSYNANAGDEGSNYNSGAGTSHSSAGGAAQNPGYPPAGFGFPSEPEVPPNMSAGGVAPNPGYPTAGFGFPSGPSFPSSTEPTPPTVNPLPMNIPPDVGDQTPIASAAGIQPSPELITKAQKYCKFATSALNYDDVPTAVTNLQKALSLLTTGRED